MTFDESITAATFHALDPIDAPVVAADRAHLAPFKGGIRGPDARVRYDAIFEAMPANEGVHHEKDMLGGVSGWWCRPKDARRDASMLYLHGGGYVLGNARPYLALAGQVATRSRVAVFVPDYRLAPESPFPAAVADAEATYRALAARTPRIVVVGDSAGGGLALALLATLVADRRTPLPVAAAVMSPWTDLAMTGGSLLSRADADPIFTPDALADLASLYLGGHDARNPLASPLYGVFEGYPPLRIDVGSDEVLLDDSLRLAERALAAGAEVSLHVWDGMAHVVPSRYGKLLAADRCLDEIGGFLGAHLGDAADG